MVPQIPFKNPNPGAEQPSNFSFKDVISIAATGFPTSVTQKITGTGTTADRVLSIATTGNPYLMSGTRNTSTTPTTPTVTQTSNAATVVQKSATVTNPTPETQTDKTNTYIIYAVVGILVIGILYWMFKK